MRSPSRKPRAPLAHQLGVDAVRDSQEQVLRLPRGRLLLVPEEQKVLSTRSWIAPGKESETCPENSKARGLDHFLKTCHLVRHSCLRTRSAPEPDRRIGPGDTEEWRSLAAGQPDRIEEKDRHERSAAGLENPSRLGKVAPGFRLEQVCVDRFRDDELRFTVSNGEAVIGTRRGVRGAVSRRYPGDLEPKAWVGRECLPAPPDRPLLNVEPEVSAVPASAREPQRHRARSTADVEHEIGFSK